MNLARLTDISELLPDQLQNLIDCSYMYAYSSSSSVACSTTGA